MFFPNPAFPRRSRSLVFRYVILATILLVLQPALPRAETGGITSGAPSGAWISQLLALPIPPTLEFCGEPVPLNREDVLERLDYELVVILGNPVNTTAWFKRIPRYFPLIEKVIAEKNLPRDLKYVALIESSLRADAVSPAGATGPWQFMPVTGDSCGLGRNDWCDERRDWREATGAALNHLADLKRAMGSWAGALAAYNAGGPRISTAMSTQIEKDFYGLRLPRETERYVFRAIAAKLVVENPALYGIRLEGARLYGPEAVTEVAVNTGRSGMSVAALAEAAGVSYRRFLELNPAIIGKDLPAGTHRIRLPRETVPLFEAAMAKRPSPPPAVAKQVTNGPKAPLPAAVANPDSGYVVQSGDTLHSIARKHGLKLNDLLTLNKLTPKSVIKPGLKLTVQPSS